MPSNRRLRLRLTITDDEGPRGATAVSVRVRDGRLDVDQRFN
jgi:hypothetical protein